MTESPMGKPQKNGNAEESNDLKKIRGIGIARQQWLRDIVGIVTIQDLANASTEQIEYPLNVAGYAISRAEIEQWIADARELSNEPSPAKDEQVELSPNIEKPADIEAEAPPQPAVEESEDLTLASFIVEFQTRLVEGQTEQQTVVCHRQSNSRQTWSGIEGEQLQQWMLELVRSAMQPEPVAEQPAAATTPLTVEITQLRAFQPPRTGMPMVITSGGEGFPGFFASGKPLVLEVAFKLTGFQGANIAQPQATYCVQFYARHRATGVKTSLGETQPQSLFAGQTTYTTMLPEITLPQPGIYRLQFLVTLQGIHAIPGFLEIPLLQVI